MKRGKPCRRGCPCNQRNAVIRFKDRSAASGHLCLPRIVSAALNAHPSGTLIADLIDELATLLTVALGGLAVSASPRREYLQVQGVRFAKGAFPFQKGKRRCNRLAPAKQRSAGIGGVIPRPVESLPRAPVPAVPLPWAPGRLCPRLNAFVTADSRQNSCAEFVATISRSTR